MYCSLRHSWLLFRPPFTWLETLGLNMKNWCCLRAPTVGSPSPLTPHQGEEQGPSSPSKLPCLRFENRTLRYGMRQHFLSSPSAHHTVSEWKGRCVSFQSGSSERPIFVSFSFVKLMGVRFPLDYVSVCCPL